AWRQRPSRGRRFDHADPDRWQHQRPHHHDRREGRRHDPPSARLNLALLNPRSTTRDPMKFAHCLLPITCAAMLASAAHAADMSTKPATAATLAANKAFGAGRSFASALETDEASRGFIAALDDSQIRDAKGNLVWDAKPYDVFKGAAPDTVNPSLWEAAKLTAKHGLFKIAEGIYQVRNYDIENMTLVAGKTG